MTLIELAEKVEAAEGADRELFFQVWDALNPVSMCWDVDEGMAYERLRNRFIELLNAEAWTDAAISLVPDGLGWVAGCGRTRPDEPLGGAIITPSATDPFADEPPISTSEASTPALALTAAALRARAGEGL